MVPGREVLLAAASGLLRSTDRIVVTGGADGSTVSYDAEVRLRGPLRVLDPSCGPVSAPWPERAAAGLAVPCPGARRGRWDRDGTGHTGPSGGAAGRPGDTP